MVKPNVMAVLILGLILVSARGYRSHLQSFLQNKDGDENYPSSFVQTGADPEPTPTGTYYICDILQHKLYIQDPVSTDGCELAPTCDPSTQIADDMIRVFTEPNRAGTCYEVLGTFSGNPKVRSVEFGADAEMISFTTTTSVTTLYATTDDVSEVAPEANMEARVLPATGARVFFQENFEGPYLDILESNTNTSDLPHIRSAKLGKDFDGIRFYDQNDFVEGNSWSYTDRNIPNLLGSVVGNVHSIRLYKEMYPRSMRFFSEPNYTGTVREIDGDAEDLGDWHWANSIESFRLGSEVNYVVMFDGDDYKGDTHAFHTKDVPKLPSDMNKDANSVDMIYTCS